MNGAMVPEVPLDVAMTRRRLDAGGNAGLRGTASEFAARLLATYGLRLAYHHHLMMVAETFGRNLHVVRPHDAGRRPVARHRPLRGSGF